MRVLLAVILFVATAQAQEASILYLVHAWAYDTKAGRLTWTLSSRRVDAEGKVLENLQQEVPYVLDLATGQVKRLRAGGYLEPYVWSEISREVLHMRGLLVSISAALDKSQPPVKNERASVQ